MTRSSVKWRGLVSYSAPVLLPGKSHGRRSLVGCSPWGCEESDTTEWLHFHFSLSCIGEGNGNPLQCSCLENPRDSGAWWAAIYGVTQSRTRLKRLSSSSSSSIPVLGLHANKSCSMDSFVSIMWLLSLNIMILWFTHVVAYKSNLFLCSEYNHNLSIFLFMNIWAVSSFRML